MTTPNKTPHPIAAMAWTKPNGITLGRYYPELAVAALLGEAPEPERVPAPKPKTDIFDGLGFIGMATA